MSSKVKKITLIVKLLMLQYLNTNANTIQRKCNQ